jgi:hypothetical protein
VQAAASSAYLAVGPSAVELLAMAPSGKKETKSERVSMALVLDSLVALEQT